MKLALVGATGFVGKAILQELLERGHGVTAIARNTDKIKGSENISPASVDILNEEDL